MENTTEITIWSLESPKHGGGYQFGGLPYTDDEPDMYNPTRYEYHPPCKGLTAHDEGVSA